MKNLFLLGLIFCAALGTLGCAAENSTHSAAPTVSGSIETSAEAKLK